MSAQYPIPVKLNIFISIVCVALYFSLIYLGTQTSGIGMKFLLGLAFGITMIPVYTLMHESAHNTLHPDGKLNTFLGRLLCTLFIIPFHFFRHCHLRHHQKSRTDDEMWDLYYEHQNKWKRHGNLYLMMIGFGYFSIWLCVIIFTISPSLIKSKIFTKHREMNGFLKGLANSTKLRHFQIESIIIIAFQVFILWMINWDFTTWIIFYAVHGFIWSSQNYVNHAFSPRDIINGAHNLTMPKWLNIIYLHFNVHLIHHQNPQIPWIHLPKYIKSGEKRFPFFTNYLRLWGGPKLTKEPNPEFGSEES